MTDTKPQEIASACRMLKRSGQHGLERVAIKVDGKTCVIHKRDSDFLLIRDFQEFYGQTPEECINKIRGLG